MNRWLPFFALIFVRAAHSAGPLPYAPAPNDTYWSEQWYLENVDTNGVPLGVDMNARSAWPLSTGQGITIAIVDDGVDLAHPDLTNKARAELHWNFASDTPDGNHVTHADKHGTPVAGLAAAETGNHRGIAAMAPDARFASWVIYKTNSIGGPFVDTNQLAKMFRFHMDEVQVQNHSWAKPGNNAFVPISTVENDAIADATQNGRQGRGVVMVRGGGNDRRNGGNASDDAFISDSRAIAVAAVAANGLVASYSNPGAAILVSAPGGDPDGDGSFLFTTDRAGSKEGYNQVNFANDLADYVFNIYGFTGTSAAAPLVSGTVALVLARNPALTVRDVQQVLLLSASQPNPNDPDLQTNGAGLLVGHNAGFGLVNAATAVDLAGRWTNRPPIVSSKTTVEDEENIPDAGLILVVQAVGGQGPNFLMTALPSLGIHADVDTPAVPLVYIGDASDPIQTNLTGKAALIQRGVTNFSVKIQNAADAGAIFAIIFNNQDTNQIPPMGRTDYAPIPAISISQRDGEILTNLVGQIGAQAQIHYEPVQYNFSVTDSLLCEHVKVTLRADHEERRDMRVTLLSPSGTRSVLQRLGQNNPPAAPFSGEWTYMTTHHFYESSQGTWQLFVGDEGVESTGTVHGATLEILGVPIKDQDQDGLDDDWEMAHFNSLASGPKDDPDLDGYSNAVEQVLGTDPTVNESPLAVAISSWDASHVRLNWTSRRGVVYQVLGGGRIDAPLQVQQEVVGDFPRTEWVGASDGKSRFYIVRERP